jgi:hypothetical protein
VQLFYLTPGNGHLLEDCHWIERKSGGSVFRQYRNNRKSFQELEAAVRCYRPDLVYLRNCYYHPNLGRILRGFPSVLELNSLWVQEAYLHRKASLRRRFLYYHLLATRRFLYNSVDGAIAVTNEIRDRELSAHCPRLPVAVIPNSIRLPSGKLKPKGAKSAGKLEPPKIVFAAGPLPVAAAHNYHGIDKIYRFAARTQGMFEFVLIGESKFYPDEKPPNIRLMGKLDREEMRAVIAGCDFGLGTVGLHRKRMEEACPLKVREYIALGLPVIIPYKDTAFCSYVPPWVLELPNREDNLDEAIEEINMFCRRLRGQRVPIEEAQAYVGAETLEKARIEFMETILEDR